MGSLRSSKTTLAVTLSLIAFLNYVRPPTGWLRNGTVHVSPDGFDGFFGHSRRLSVRTLQRAADLVEPGETILIWPGTYRESFVLRRGGQKGKPVVIRAAVPGEAVITAAARSSAVEGWTWSQHAPDVYSTPI